MGRVKVIGKFLSYSQTFTIQMQSLKYVRFSSSLIIRILQDVEKDETQKRLTSEK